MIETPNPDLPDAAIRDARRAWYFAGIRRRDRALLTSELRNELACADEHDDVLGDDPAATAREWARERGITDRRARLVVVLPAAVIPGVLVSGGVLALVYQAFADNGNTPLSHVSGPVLLGIYVATGVVAYVSMLVGVAAALTCLHDRTLRSTVRTFATSLPAGAVLATVAGVLTAAAQDFETSRTAATLDISAVLVTLVLVLSASRVAAVRLAHRHDTLPAGIWLD